VIRSRKLTLAGVGVGCLVLFGGCGALLGSAGDASPAPAETDLLPTVYKGTPRKHWGFVRTVPRFTACVPLSGAL